MHWTCNEKRFVWITTVFEGKAERGRPFTQCMKQITENTLEKTVTKI